MVGKSYFDFAPETSYGVLPTTGWKSIRVKDDGHKDKVLTLAPGGIVRGQQGPVASGRRSVVLDPAGTVKTYLMSNGLGSWFRAAFGNAVLSTPVGATAARKMVFTTTDALSAFSLATQLGREMKSGTVDPSTHLGGQVSELRISQAVAPDGGGVGDEALAAVEFDLGYQSNARGTAAHGSSTLIDPDLYMSAGECTLSLGPAGTDPEDLDPECLNKFEFKLPTGPDSDRCINASFVKDKATRGELPLPTLGLGWTYKNRSYYDAYLDGDVMAFRAYWEPAGTAYEIEAGINPSVTLDLPAIQLTGDTPQMDEAGKTTQDLPADVLWNGTQPMATLTIITSDTAF